MGKANPSRVRAYAEAAGNGEWPIGFGRSGLCGCLETRQGRGVRGDGNLGSQGAHSLIRGQNSPPVQGRNGGHLSGKPKKVPWELSEQEEVGWVQLGKAASGR